VERSGRILRRFRMRRRGGGSKPRGARSAPAVVAYTGPDTRRIKNIVVPGVVRPPGGFKTAKELDRACAQAGIPGAMESEVVRNANESLRRGPVAADKRTR